MTLTMILTLTPNPAATLTLTLPPTLTLTLIGYFEDPLTQVNDDSTNEDASPPPSPAENSGMSVDVNPCNPAPAAASNHVSTT